MTRDEIVKNNQIGRYLFGKGVILKKRGSALVCLCPLHDEKTASFTVNKDETLWKCHGCGKNGSIIDLVSEMEGISVGAAMKKLSGEQEETPKQPSGKIVAEYSYTDEDGNELYQSVRYEPKTFKQRRKIDGKWLNTLSGVTRVLYRLPNVKKSSYAWIVEGEKDVDSLEKLGFVATTNAGGSNGWLDSYAESLLGKEVYVCSDNDEPGEKHAKAVIDSLKEKTIVRRIELPKQFKDVTDFINAHADAKQRLESLQKTAVLVSDDIPLCSSKDLKNEYNAFISDKMIKGIDLSSWIPSLAEIRSLVPGELVTFIGSTGIGKTAILQNIAYHIKVPTLIFEIELPQTLMFERFMAISKNMKAELVEQHYRTYGEMDGDEESIGHIYVCPLSDINTEKIESLILRSELKMGVKPSVVMIDYVGLLSDKGGSRYERMSSIAERLKVIAKKMKVVLIVCSQIHRKEDGEQEVYLHDAKDSGSIENSSGLVIGAWRSTRETMTLKILKNTKGQSGKKIECNFNGATLRITERGGQEKLLA